MTKISLFSRISRGKWDFTPKSVAARLNPSRAHTMRDLQKAARLNTTGTSEQRDPEKLQGVTHGCCNIANQELARFYGLDPKSVKFKRYKPHAVKSRI